MIAKRALALSSRASGSGASRRTESKQQSLSVVAVLVASLSLSLGFYLCFHLLSLHCTSISMPPCLCLHASASASFFLSVCLSVCLRSSLFLRCLPSCLYSLSLAFEYLLHAISSISSASHTSVSAWINRILRCFDFAMFVRAKERGDKNHDGKLSREEMAALLPFLQARGFFDVRKDVERIFATLLSKGPAGRGSE